MPRLNSHSNPSSTGESSTAKKPSFFKEPLGKIAGIAERQIVVEVKGSILSSSSAKSLFKTLIIDTFVINTGCKV